MTRTLLNPTRPAGLLKSGKKSGKGILLLVMKICEELEKIKEKSGNLNINGYDSPQEISLFCSRGKDVLSSGIVKAHLPSYLGLFLKERICCEREQIL